VAVAVAVILSTGMVKSITGLGIPVVATPLLVVLYGHLPTVVVIMSIPTLVGSSWYVIQTRRQAREAFSALAPLLPFGVLGVLLGSRLLVTVPPQILAGVLAAVIGVFVVNALIGGAAVASVHPPRAVAPAVGFAAGGLQGSSGASGPLLTMYLLRRPLSREGFLLAVNVAFVVLDVSQIIALASLGQYTQQRLIAGFAAIVPLVAGILIGGGIARDINDKTFRYGVLTILALTSITLAGKALG
jgi:uncharacterized protein